MHIIMHTIKFMLLKMSYVITSRVSTCQLEITRFHCIPSVFRIVVLRNVERIIIYLPELDDMELCIVRVVHSDLHSFRMVRSGIFRLKRGWFFSDLDANVSTTLFAYLTRSEIRGTYLTDDDISIFFFYSCHNS